MDHFQVRSERLKNKDAGQMSFVPTALTASSHSAGLLQPVTGGVLVEMNAEEHFLL